VTTARKAAGSRRLQSGQSVVEFACAIVAALWLLFGTFEFGRAMYCYYFVCDLAREASRYAAMNGASSPDPVTASGVQTFVIDELPPGLEASSLVVNTTWTPNNSIGGVVAVTVQYNFKPVTPFFPDTSLTLSSSSQFTIDQ
jgi:Flp pilus assembly protein TadG